MNRAALTLCALLLGAFPLSTARADEPAVKTTATVEVIDDTAHVDDVISRMKKEPVRPETGKPGEVELKKERPPVETQRPKRESVSNEERENREAVWRSRQERTGNSERTERARRKNK